MRLSKLRALALSGLAAILLSACGGGDDKPTFNRIVSFGDSLSDVGSYATPALVAATGGGKYTVNGPNGKVWVELLASRLGLGSVCAAQVGLESSGPLAGFAAAVTNKPGCYGYAQGGARVTNPVGPANKALIALGDTSGYLGQMTDPVVNQMNRHANTVGYTGNELVVVLAGGNDVFMNLAAVGAGTPPATAIAAMGTAGAELVGYVKNLVVAKGARYVAVVNLPDVSLTPFGRSQSAATQGLLQAFSKAFNDQLAAGLAGNPNVLYIDGAAQTADQAANPSKYGITNSTVPACDPAKATLGSLGCSAATLIAGDTSKYQFADSVHPTPYGHQLTYEFVLQSLGVARWL